MPRGPCQAIGSCCHRSISDRQSGSTASVARKCDLGWDKSSSRLPDQELCMDPVTPGARQVETACSRHAYKYICSARGCRSVARGRLPRRMPAVDNQVVRRLETARSTHQEQRCALELVCIRKKAHHVLALPFLLNPGPPQTSCAPWTSRCARVI